jgi:hypothetical protein
VKLKYWPEHITDLLRQRPDLAEAHVVREIRCVGAIENDRQGLFADQLEGM